MASLIRTLGRLDAHHRVIAALITAGTLFFILRGRVRESTDAIASWDAFSFVILSLAWIVILNTPQPSLRARAQAQDVGHLVVFIMVVIAASVALFSVGFLLGRTKSAPQPHLLIHLSLTLATVVFSWALVHTVFGLRYAHAFYGDSDDPKHTGHAGGLIFPGDRPPDYFDFAYYAFVVGMTCQVSDVQITSRQLRRLTLTHSVLAFGFNTIILALLINTVSSLI